MRTPLYFCLVAALACMPSLAQHCTPVATAPWCEDFNAAASLPANWVGGTPSWIVRAGSTPSANTGPTDDCTGGGNYAFVETSGSTAMSITTLVAPCTDVSGIIEACRTISFCYHMYFNGAADGTLRLEVFDGTNWNMIWQMVGDQGQAWHTAEVPLTPADVGPGGELEFRFWFQTGSIAATFEYDVAIDNVCVGKEFQTSTPEISLSNRVGGVTTPPGTSATPSTTVVCPNTNVCLDFSTLITGQPFDIRVQVGPPSPASGAGFVIPSCQIVNVDFNLPCPAEAFFLVGEAGDFCRPNVSSTVFGNALSVCFNVGPNPFVASAQAYVLDPTASDGIRLSQPIQLDVNAVNTGTFGGPITDDGCVEIDLGCPYIQFCGQSYQRINVSANGRILFGACDTDFNATVAEAQNDVPSIGFWTDLHPGQGGAISIDVDLTRVRVNYTNVPHRNAAGTMNTFFIELFPNGDAIIGNLSGIVSNPLTGINNAQFLGLSCGNSVSGGAIDPGAQAFCAGNAGGGVADAMLYDFYDGTASPPGLVPSLDPLGPCAANLPNTITFTWNPGTGAYSWAASN